MTIVKNILLAGMVLGVGGAVGRAQIVYSNAFNGGLANINGTVPTEATGFAGGSTSATWNDVLGVHDTNVFYANGTPGTGQGDSLLLPFTPQSGYLYTLTASLTFYGNPGSWIGVGFAQNNSVNQTAARFADSPVNGYDFMILTESSGNVQYFTGPRGNTPQIFDGTGFSGGAQTLTAQVLLNTTGSVWSIAASVNGTPMGSTTTYANNPAIGAVGFTQTTLSAPANYRWNYMALTASGPGPATNTVFATVSFSPTNMGLPLNPSFNGLSYEKSKLTTIGFFHPTNTALIKLFSQVGPAVLRIGGGTVDTTGWNAISNTYPITSAEVDDLAGFMKALPTNWSVIYGINLLSNTPANCAAEAVYAQNALGSRLLGFEIGNEPEFGFSQYSTYLGRWRPLAAAVTNAVPGWAVTNNGNGWIFADADAGQGQLAAFTDPFASDESGVVSLLTQHYYRAGPSTNDTMQLLLQPDPFLLQLVTNIVGAAAGHCPLGARITETGSYSAGGIAGISDAFGAALWSLDFMFTMALNGGAGVNFHGGGLSPYSPLVDNGPVVTTVGPEFYALKLFSMLPPGNVISANVSLGSPINFTAYGVRQANGAVSALLNNKETSNTLVVTVSLGSYVSSAQVTELAGPTLFNTSDYTIGGAVMNPDGSWSGGVQAVLPATNGQLTVVMPPASAWLLNAVVTNPTVAVALSGNQLTLSWPTNYTGWLLQADSFSLVHPNWLTVAGSANTNRVQLMVPPGQNNMFYRLAAP